MSLLQTLFFAVLSLSLMYADSQSGLIHRYRESASVIAYPVQWLSDAPLRLVHWLSHSVSYQQQIVTENAKLRAKELLLQSQLQKVLVLQKENTQLKSLLQTRSQMTGKVKLSRILAIQLTPGLKQMIVSGGKNEHAYVGQPVLDGYGVMGQIVGVNDLASRMLLITDKHFSIPVQDYRNGLRFIASGTGSGDHLELVDVMPRSDIKMGDLFVSSGYGLRFPIGYPVGVVTQINQSSLGRFMHVALIPSAHLNQTQLVLLSWPSQAKLEKTVMEAIKQPLTKSGVD